MRKMMRHAEYTNYDDINTNTTDNLSKKQVASVCVCDGHISLTVSQTDLGFRMWLAHGTKLCILDFEKICLRFSKDDYLTRPSSRGSVLFPMGPLLEGLLPRSLCDRLTPG